MRTWAQHSETRKWTAEKNAAYRGLLDQNEERSRRSDRTPTFPVGCQATGLYRKPWDRPMAISSGACRHPAGAVIVQGAPWRLIGWRLGRGSARGGQIPAGAPHGRYGGARRPPPHLPPAKFNVPDSVRASSGSRPRG